MSTETKFDRLAICGALDCLIEFNTDEVWHLDHVYTSRANVSGFVTNPERFGPAFCLPFTAQNMNPGSKLSGFVMNPETFVSGT